MIYDLQSSEEIYSGYRKPLGPLQTCVSHPVCRFLQTFDGTLLTNLVLDQGVLQTTQAFTTSLANNAWPSWTFGSLQAYWGPLTVWFPIRSSSVNPLQGSPSGLYVLLLFSHIALCENAWRYIYIYIYIYICRRETKRGFVFYSSVSVWPVGKCPRAWTPSSVSNTASQCVLASATHSFVALSAG